jgi:hypothetical protein
MSRTRTLRRVTPAVCVVAVAGLLGVLTPAAATAQDHERSAELYFDAMALNLAEPGLWIDPASASTFSGSRAAELDAAIRAAPVPMRIAVIPASVLVAPEGRSLRTEVLWEGPEMATKLYERVGLDGVYAILVDARSAEEGREFWAVQHAAAGPTYHVESAVDQAIDCCAPVYDAMLARFIQRASQVDRPLYLVAGPIAVGAVGAFGLWWAGASTWARRQERREDERHLLTVRPLLNEEVIELSATVSALPTTSDIEQARLTREVLDAVEHARHRLDALATDNDVAAVTTLLGNARYQLHCLTALHRGEAKPERTPPCFFDPRHGPSTQQRRWAPTLVWGADGAEREISACPDCAERLDNEQPPEARMVGERRYWEAGEDLVAYIEGYWQAGDHGWRFPDGRHHQSREAMLLRRQSRRPAQRLARGAHLAAAGIREAAKDSGGGSGRSFGGGSAGSSSVGSSGGGRF